MQPLILQRCLNTLPVDAEGQFLVARSQLACGLASRSAKSTSTKPEACDTAGYQGEMTS